MGELWIAGAVIALAIPFLWVANVFHQIVESYVFEVSLRMWAATFVRAAEQQSSWIPELRGSMAKKERVMVQLQDMFGIKPSDIDVDAIVEEAVMDMNLLKKLWAKEGYSFIPPTDFLEGELIER